MRTKQAQIGWNDERLAYLREHYPTKSGRELTKAFNEHFGLNVTEASVGFQLHRHRILKRPRQVT